MVTRPERPVAPVDAAERTPASLIILTPTFLEYGAVRSLLPRAHVVRTGIGLSEWNDVPQKAAVVVCGLAGALDAGLEPGTVVVPDQVGLTDGTTIHCDVALTKALSAAARTLGFEPDTRPLLTAPGLVTGAERAAWARNGYVAVDMETGRLDQSDTRLATIRVVLDTPKHEISQEWLTVRRTILRPALWPQLLWLSWKAPWYALRAARVLRAGLALLGEET